MKKILTFFIAVLAGASVFAATNYSCDFETEAARDRWVLNPAANLRIYNQLTNKW